MSEFSDTIRRVTPAIDEMISGAGEIIAKDKYSEINSIFDNMQKQKDEILKRQALEMKYQNGLGALKTAPDMLYKNALQVDKYNPALETTEAFNRYNFYRKQAGDGANGQPVMSFEEFVAGDEPSKQELLTKQLAAENKTMLAGDEIQNLIYKHGGFTPEEIKQYNDVNAKNKSRKDFNSEVSNFLTQNQGIFLGKGAVGEKYFNALKNRAGSLQIVPTKGDWQFEKIGDSLYRIDLTTGQPTEIVKGDPKLSPMSGIKPRVIQNDDGSYSWKIAMIDNKGKTTFQIAPGATENDFNIQEAEDKNKSADWFEKRDYIQGQKIEYKGMFPRLGGKSKKGSIKDTLDDVDKKVMSDIKSWGLSGRKWATMSDTEKKKYTDTEQELAKLYTGGDVKKLQDLKEKMIKGKGKNNDEKAYLDFINGEGEAGNTPTMPVLPGVTPTVPNTNTSKSKNVSYKDIGEQFSKNKYLAPVSNEPGYKQYEKARNKIVQRTNDIITSWGRSNLTTAEWRNEFIKKGIKWTPQEYELLKQIFKDNFGEEL